MPNWWVENISFWFKFAWSWFQMKFNFILSYVYYLFGLLFPWNVCVYCSFSMVYLFYITDLWNFFYMLDTNALWIYVLHFFFQFKTCLFTYLIVLFGNQKISGSQIHQSFIVRAFYVLSSYYPQHHKNIFTCFSPNCFKIFLFTFKYLIYVWLACVLYT